MQDLQIMFSQKSWTWKHLNKCETRSKISFEGNDRVKPVRFITLQREFKLMKILKEQSQNFEELGEKRESLWREKREKERREKIAKSENCVK